MVGCFRSELRGHMSCSMYSSQSHIVILNDISSKIITRGIINKIWSPLINNWQVHWINPSHCPCQGHCSIRVSWVFKHSVFALVLLPYPLRSIWLWEILEASLDLACTQLPCFHFRNYMKSGSYISSIKILVGWTSINTGGCILEILFKFVVFNPRGVLSLSVEFLSLFFYLSFKIRFSVLLIVNNKVETVGFR